MRGQRSKEEGNELLTLSCKRRLLSSADGNLYKQSGPRSGPTFGPTKHRSWSCYKSFDTLIVFMKGKLYKKAADDKKTHAKYEELYNNFRIGFACGNRLAMAAISISPPPG